MKIGDYNRLSISREASMGMFLCDELGMEVLLPNRYVPQGVKEGDELEVFVYRDSEDRPIATTETPKARVHSIAELEVLNMTPVGAFLDWGLPKDLLLPKREQVGNLQEGDHPLVYVYLDRVTQRLAASMRLERYLSDKPINLEKGQEVELIIWKAHDRGFQVVVDEEYLGMIYRDQVFERVVPGEKRKGYVNAIREDGKIDVLLQKPGYDHIDDAQQAVLEALKANGGFLPLTDKSPPGAVKSALQMSKKSFKKAVGALYKARKVRIEDKGIQLI